MDLSKILSISGEAGLFKMVGQMKNGVVVESLITGKRSPAYAAHRISTLEDISIYTEEKDLPLKEVFEAVYKKQEGKSVEQSLNDNAGVKAYFESVVPDYDQERVYQSDMKKVIKWYNILCESENFSFEEEIENAKESEDVKDKSLEKSETKEKKTAPAKATSKKAKTPTKAGSNAKLKTKKAAVPTNKIKSTAGK